MRVTLASGMLASDQEENIKITITDPPSLKIMTPSTSIFISFNYIYCQKTRLRTLKIMNFNVSKTHGHTQASSSTHWCTDPPRNKLGAEPRLECSIQEEPIILAPVGQKIEIDTLDCLGGESNTNPYQALWQQEAFMRTRKRRLQTIYSKEWRETRNYIQRLDRGKKQRRQGK